jgi:serine protease
MNLPSTLRRLAVCCLALAAGATQALAAARRAAPPEMVDGLVVQLRDAPSHVAVARERVLARDAAALPREARRWQGLLAEVRADPAVLRELPQWAAAAPSREPVGARAQLLRFTRSMTPAQAERVAARLAARPEVAWVAVNGRERRQALAANAPGDPYYGGSDGQWWLQAVGPGSNASAIADRRRGVSDFLPAWLNGSTGNAAAIVAVLDSGITCHPDLGNTLPACLGGAILPGYDFVSDSARANDGDGRDADPRDPGDWVSQADRSNDPDRYGDCEVEGSSWHGTTIAGLVAARTDNQVGVAGINWDGRVLPVRVAGKCGAATVDIVDGMRWAAGLDVCKRSDNDGNCLEFVPRNPHPARIVSISFGGTGACNALYQEAIDEARAAPGGGAVVVVAAGNEWGAPRRPADCRHVIAVGSLNRDGFKSNYSNFGAALAISTVGGDDDDGAWGAPLGSSSLADSGILTIGSGAPTTPADCMQPGANCYYYHFGTSFSAPIVAGAVSLMLSVNPALSASEIELGLARSARPHVTSSVPGFGLCSASNPGRCLCTTSTCGAGILDANQALLYAAAPTSYVAPAAQAAVLDTPELRVAVASGPDRPPQSRSGEPTGGGGAMGMLWLLGLAAAGLVLASPFSVPAGWGRPGWGLRTVRNQRPARRR